MLGQNFQFTNFAQENTPQKEPAKSDTYRNSWKWVAALTQAELVDAGGDDDEEGAELGQREVVLDLGGRLHAPAVDEGQQADTASS